MRTTTKLADLTDLTEISSMYQLGCKKRSHEAFCGFDNWPACRASSQRFTIVFTIRKLGTRENRVVTDLVSRMHGPEAAGIDLERPNVEPPVLEYMKYVIVYKANSMTAVYDLDLCRAVRPPIDCGLRRALTEMRMVPITSSLVRVTEHDDADVPVPLTHGAPMHKGAIPVKQRKFEYPTATHGVVKITLSRYADPDIRNGFTISVGKNLNKQSCWGALVTPSNPKDVTLKRITDLPAKKSASQAEKANDGSFYKKKDCEVEYDGEKIVAPLLVPKCRKPKIRPRRVGEIDGALADVVERLTGPDAIDDSTARETT